MNRQGALGLILVIASVCLPGCGGSESIDPARPNAPLGGPAGGPAPGGVAFVGFDCSPPLVDALREGTLHGIVVQNPYKMGRECVRVMVDHLEGRQVEGSLSTGETLVTPANMDEPAIQSLLNAPKADPTADANLAAKEGGKKWRIMVIPKGTTHEHWKSVHAGAVAMAEELGTVEIIWIGPQKENDRTQQITLVDNAAAAGVSGIVLAPLDAEALVAPVERAVSRGIPVVIFDSALNSDKPVSYVATDNYRGGVLAAERLAELLGGKGKIILLRYDIGSAATEEREKGFTDTIAKHPQIEYLSDDQYAGATTETAQKTAQSLVIKFRGQVEGIFTPNESSTSGMLRALRDAGMLGVRR